MTGLVTLLGAGPGDQELIAVKGVRRLKEADVLVYDRLINQDLFKYLSEGCEKIYVGKNPGMPCIAQEEIEALLIEKAQEGKTVVRLKSGDPYIFGRGGEEARSLMKAGIDFEVIPGISSAVAGLTYAGIPITYRDVATSFHVFTGHLKDETENLNWGAISQLKGTLVFLMGMKNLSTIVSELRNHGMADETPVAIVEWATHPRQRSVDGNLATIEELVAKYDLKAPSIIVVGDVVAFRKELNFHERLPLFGRTILIQESPTGKLPNLLKDDGATLVTFPARTKTDKLQLELPDLETVDGLLIADHQSWHFFLDYLKEQGKDLRSLGHLKIAAVGQHTSKGIEANGIMLHAKGTLINGTDIVGKLSKETGNWYILAPTHKKEDLKEYYDFPILSTHTVDFDHEIEEANWSAIQLICLPNSVAATNFVAMTKCTEADWKSKTIVVMGDATRTVVEKAGFTKVVETDEPTIVAIRDKSRQLLG